MSQKKVKIVISLISLTVGFLIGVGRERYKMVKAIRKTF